MPQVLIPVVPLAVMWMVVYLGFVFVLGYQTYATLKDFYSYPVTTSVSLKTATHDVTFPTITVCNNNIVRKSYITRITYLQDLAFLDDYVVNKLRSEVEQSAEDTSACEEKDWFVCGNKQCIPKAWVCNGRSECGDDSDEKGDSGLNCDDYETRNTSQVCSDEFMICPGEKTCATECNGVKECVVSEAYDESSALGCPDICLETKMLTATDVEQTVTSPNYPNDYGNDLKCEYQIRASDGKVIEVTITDMDIEEEPQCAYDSLRIRNGLTNQHPFFKVNQNSKICGDLESLNSRETFTSRTNGIILYFETDSIESRKGWKMTFKSVGANRVKRSSNDSDDSDHDSGSGSGLSSDYQGFRDYDYFQSGANFNNVKDYDWFQAFQMSVMPDYSDFRNFLNFEKAEIIGNGHQKEDFIVQCVYDGALCGPQSFSTTQHPEFGNCFSFNAVINIHSNVTRKPKTTLLTGSENGLKLSLFLDKDEYVGILGQKSGARLTISNSLEEPPKGGKATFLSSGVATSLSLEQEVLVREGDPYSECAETWPKELLLSENYQKYEYTFEQCMYICQQEILANTCDCTTAFEKDFSSDEAMRSKAFSHCDVWDTATYKCIQSVQKQFLNGSIACKCPAPCSERKLVVSASESDWPTEAYAPHFAALLQRSSSKRVREFVNSAIEKSKGTDVALMKQILGLNFARVEVHFATLNFYEIKETPKYGYADLFGILGGNLGLWLGWSVMAIFELIQLAYFCLKIMIS